MTTEELQAIRNDLEYASKGVALSNPWASTFRMDVPKLLGEIERLQPHNLVGQVDELLKLGTEMRRTIAAQKQEIERLTTENTYHSLQLDRAKEDIRQFRSVLVGELL
jgi:hypothetical protein